MNNQWHPIETAPRNGTWILVIVAGTHKLTGKPFIPSVAYLDEQDYVYEVEVEDDNGLISVSEWGLTHWMPLPEPPDEDTKGLVLGKRTVSNMALLMEEASRNLAAVMDLPEAEDMQIRYFLPDELDGCAIMLREAYGIEPPQES